MNKSQALEWLIENVTRWPAKKGGIVSAPKSWQWGYFNDGEIRLVKTQPTEMYADCHIGQSEWLDYKRKPYNICGAINEMHGFNDAHRSKQEINPKKIYIAGPMTGYKNFNRDAFNKAAEMILFQRNVPLNPAILPDGLTQPEYMQLCLPMVMMADGIVLLKGWEKSKGAQAEYALAVKIELDIFEDK